MKNIEAVTFWRMLKSLYLQSENILFVQPFLCHLLPSPSSIALSTRISHAEYSDIAQSKIIERRMPSFWILGFKQLSGISGLQPAALISSPITDADPEFEGCSFATYMYKCTCELISSQSNLNLAWKLGENRIELNFSTKRLCCDCSILIPL